MEGVREKPTYKELLNKPLLNFSGAMQHMDLYMTAQIFADGEPLCMPVKTSYKSMEPPPLPQHSQQQQHQHQHQQQRATPWVWDEWLTMPLKISDLPRNSLLALTAWDVESPQDGDVAVCGATIALFDKHGEFRQGVLELRLWPNRAADGSSVKTSTPGIVSDLREHEMDERQQHQIMQQQQQQQQQKNAASLQSATAAISSSASASATTTTQQQQRSPDEFPMLDELDRLAKMSKQYTNGHMIKQDWLDKMTFQELHNSMRREKKALSMAPASASSSSSASSAPSCRPFFLSIEFPQIRSDDVKYVVLYYEEDAERIIQTIPSNELFVVNDPELELVCIYIDITCSLCTLVLSLSLSLQSNMYSNALTNEGQRDRAEAPQARALQAARPARREPEAGQGQQGAAQQDRQLSGDARAQARGADAHVEVPLLLDAEQASVDQVLAVLQPQSRVRGQHAHGAHAEVAADGCRGRSRAPRLQVQELHEYTLLCSQPPTTRLQRRPHTLLATARPGSPLRELRQQQQQQQQQRGQQGKLQRQPVDI